MSHQTTPDNHIVTDEELIAFELGELDAEASARVTRHVAKCRQCQTSLANLKTLRTVVRGDDSVAAPPATIARAQAIFRQRTSFTGLGWFVFGRHRRFVGVSALAMVLLLATFLFGTVALAGSAIQGTLPGDTLYPVKTTFEDVSVAVAPNDSSKVEAQLSIAQARVTEISALVAQGRYNLLPQATQDYQVHVEAATTTLDNVLKQNPSQAPLGQKAEQDLTRYETTLAVIQANTPGTAQSDIHQAVVASNAAKSSVQTQLQNISSPSGVVPLPSATSTSSALFKAPATIPPTPSSTLAPAPTITATTIPSATSTIVPPTSTIPPTNTPTNTAAILSTPTAPSSLVATAVPPATASPSPTATIVTATATLVASPTATFPPTLTPTATSTLTPTPTATMTPTLLPVSIQPTSTSIPSPTPRPQPTATPTSTQTSITGNTNLPPTATLTARPTATMTSTATSTVVIPSPTLASLKSRPPTAAPSNTVASAGSVSPSTATPTNVLMTPASELVPALVQSIESSSICLPSEIDAHATCDATTSGQSHLPPIIFGFVALLASLGIIVRYP